MKQLETKDCKYCGEQIAISAKKCKHCNEWLEDNHSNNKTEENNDNKSTGFSTRIISSIFLFGIGWSLFKFGSWKLIIGKKIPTIVQYINSGNLKTNIIWEENGILFRFNEKFYGFTNNHHYFDSPILQWFMLIFSIMSFIYAINMLLFGSYGDD
ncbi:MULTISPECIES: hypothetical protein [Empedobacter]|uniref:hypothetical protein n=1 Tax=Empedobacter TaxID=59734 RepID=UPI0025770EE7|nr:MULTISPECIES: hypothetical protein [Empedobacter]MDM1043105.1 hypothetical protein [Empedobacter brevis]MDM1137019.1 hypothetical protein [Empedobacter sp. R750]